MSYPTVVPGGGAPSPSLDREDTSARKRRRRLFHRVMSGLEKRGQVRLLTLTSAAPDTAGRDFQTSFRRLRMRLLRRGMLVDYIRCPEYTKKGARHEHILFRGSFIEQRYLSHLWQEIHNSPVIDIRGIRAGKRALAGYLASYMAKSPAGRYAYSWGWVWKGFVKSWTFLRRLGYAYGMPFQDILHMWRILVQCGKRPEEHWRLWAREGRFA